MDDMDAAQEPGRLRRNAMGAPEIVFLVVAFSAPLAASTTQIPLALGFGNGIGAPGMWVLTGLVLGLFSVGFVAMSRRIANTGAFYAYITSGLGRRLGVGSGYVALIAYTGAVIFITGFFGFFASALLDSELGISISWPVCGLVGLAAVFMIGVIGVRTNVKLLGVLLTLETLLLLIIIVAILVTEGPGAYTMKVFTPANVFGGAPGLAFAFIVATFLGFEATAIYSEEARNPKRTVPRATYAAIALITVLYSAAAWSAVAAIGEKGIASASKDPGTLMFVITEQYLGGWAVTALNILIVTSLFAVLIAAHNSCARYLYSLGRDGWLPKGLARVHPQYQTPHVAAALQAGLSALVVLVFAIAGADPFTGLGAPFVGLDALGIVALEVLVCAAVVRFFWSRRQEVGIWTAVIAPGVAGIILAGACVLMIDNFGMITGSESTIVALLPLVLLGALVVGIVVGGRARTAEMDQISDDEDERPLAAAVS
jgi:amino acid transporter